MIDIRLTYKKTQFSIALIFVIYENIEILL